VIPAWAVELTTSVCEAAGRPLPILRWRRRDRVGSSGVTRHASGTVSVTAGSDETDARITLLHELAHWIGPAPVRRRRARIAHHDARFWTDAFALYARHGIPPVEALRLESLRYPSSLRHAYRLGVPGAAAAITAHRTRLHERRIPWRILVPEHTIKLARDGRWTVCAVCHRRIVGRNLVRLRRGGRQRHVLLTRESAA
jgi:hypothetical protein